MDIYHTTHTPIKILLILYLHSINPLVTHSYYHVSSLSHYLLLQVMDNDFGKTHDDTLPFPIDTTLLLTLYYQPSINTLSLSLFTLSFSHNLLLQVMDNDFGKTHDDSLGTLSLPLNRYLYPNINNYQYYHTLSHSPYPLTGTYTKTIQHLSMLPPINTSHSRSHSSTQSLSLTLSLSLSLSFSPYSLP